MQMLTALFGSLRGVFSKTYLLTGLLPAAMILLSREWYIEGETIGTLLVKDTMLAPAVILAVQLLGLGLLFYALHQPLLRFFGSIPGKLFEQPREFMVQCQIKKRQKIILEQKTRLWEYTAATWPMRGFKQEVNYVPPWSERATPAAVIKASRLAQRTVDSLVAVTHGVTAPQRDAINVIVKGLCQLMELSRKSHQSKESQEEKMAWKTLYEHNDTVKAVLQHIQNHCYRLFVEAQDELSAFPRDTKWMKPTALGNRLAALDDYAERRYGIATSTLWSRLWAVIAEDDRQGVADAQLMVNMLLNLSVASLGALTIVAIAALQTTWQLTSMERGSLQPDWRAILFIAVAALLSRVFYLSAVAGFRSVQEHVIRLIDLNRSSLIKKLGFEVPTSLALEKKFFKDLSVFFTDGSDSIHQWPCHDGSAFALGLTQKLKSVSVKNIMIPKSLIISHPASQITLNTLSITNIIELLNRAKQSALLLLNDGDHLIYVIPKSELDRFLAQKANVVGIRAPQINRLTLKDLFSESPALRMLFQTNFATASKTASLADAQKAMGEIRDCLDVFVTEDGKKASSVVGWVTNVQIAEAMRA